jgi:hypothetical protein
MLAHKPDVRRHTTSSRARSGRRAPCRPGSRSSPTCGPRSSTGAPTERAPTPLRASGED